MAPIFMTKHIHINPYFAKKFLKIKRRGKKIKLRFTTLILYSVQQESSLETNATYRIKRILVHPEPSSTHQSRSKSKINQHVGS